MSEQWRTSLLWRKDEPDVGHWVEVQHKGICQYLGPSDITDHKYIDRNGTTHSIGNYGWRPLPATHEERRLRELLRWRKWPEDVPDQHGLYVTTGYHFGLNYYHLTDGWQNPQVVWWKVIGPMPGEGGE